MRTWSIGKWLLISVFTASVIFFPSTLYFLDKIGAGLLSPRLENLSIQMAENWFPYASNRRGLQYWGEKIYGRTAANYEVLQFSRPSLGFGKRSKIIFGRSLELRRLYEVSGLRKPFIKSIKYRWGTADFLEDGIADGGDITVVAREYDLLIVTNDKNGLSDIEKIAPVSLP